MLRWGMWILILAIAALALFWLADRLAESFVSGQLDAMAERSSAVVDSNNPPQVEVDLLQGSVQISSFSLIPTLDRTNAAFQLIGKFDTLAVTRISLRKALFQHCISADAVMFRSSSLHITMREDSVQQATGDTRPKNNDPWSFAIAALAMDLGPITYVNAKGDSMATYGKGIALSGQEMKFAPDPHGGRPSFRVDGVRLSTDSIKAVLASGYAWSIGSCALDQRSGTFELYSALVGPITEMEEYSKGLKYETDVIEARIDTLLLAGLDINAALADGVMSLRKATILKGDATVLRDKTLQDGPSVEQALLAKLIRKLPVGSRCDTVSVSHLDVRYRERSDYARGFALIPFGQIRATISGVQNVVEDTTAFMIQARCTAFDDTPVAMVLRSVVQDTMDRFVLDASIGKLSFLALNKVTGPLMDVRSTSGRIDTVMMHMDADKQRAKGRVRMAYHDLKLASGGKKRKEPLNMMKTVALNTLVQNDNLDKGGPRPGQFAFERRQDRAVFNYMWSGLREGTKAILLPEVLTR